MAVEVATGSTAAKSNGNCNRNLSYLQQLPQTLNSTQISQGTPNYVKRHSIGSFATLSQWTF